MIKECIRNYLNGKDIYLYRNQTSRDNYVASMLRDKMVSASKGVLHIGAHTGQEADYYANLDVKVMWIEADPQIYSILLKKLANYPKQKAICALIGSTNKKRVKFKISSNDGLSSSIFNFGNEVYFKNLEMINLKYLNMKRLDSCLSKKTILNYPHWVIDVQGAELEVLKGAGKLLDGCYSLQVEVTSRNLYQSGARFNQVHAFLKKHGFINIQKHNMGSHEDLFFLRAHH